MKGALRKKGALSAVERRRYSVVFLFDYRSIPIKTTSASPLAVRTLLISVGSLGFAQTVLFAVLAPLGREAGLAEVQIGAIISASSLTIFLAAPKWGRASDMYGRRRILLIGLFGYTFGNLLFFDLRFFV